jgi:Ca2+-binding EF-hand superfamily protein
MTPTQNKNTMKTKLAVIALMVGISADFAIAQQGPGAGQGRRGRPDGSQGQNGGPGGEQGGPRRMPPFIAALDTNQDQIIDAAELAAAPTSLKKLDTNSDGSLTADELHPRRGPGGPGGPDGGAGPDGEKRPNRPLPPMLAALDVNQDGTIDAAELANAAVALKTLDKNQDGQLSAEELRPGRGQGGPGRRPGRGAEAPGE